MCKIVDSPASAIKLVGTLDVSLITSPKPMPEFEKQPAPENAKIQDVLRVVAKLRRVLVVFADQLCALVDARTPVRTGEEDKTEKGKAKKSNKEKPQVSKLSPDTPPRRASDRKAMKASWVGPESDEGVMGDLKSMFGKCGVRVVNGSETGFIEMIRRKRSCVVPLLFLSLPHSPTVHSGFGTKKRRKSKQRQREESQEEEKKEDTPIETVAPVDAKVSRKPICLSERLHKFQRTLLSK